MGKICVFTYRISAFLPYLCILPIEFNPTVLYDPVMSVVGSSVGGNDVQYNDNATTQVTSRNPKRCV